MTHWELIDLTNTCLWMASTQSMWCNLIYFSSSEISDFEFHPPVMDWTRRFSVAFKERAAVCIMPPSLSLFFICPLSAISSFSIRSLTLPNRHVRPRKRLMFVLPLWSKSVQMWERNPHNQQHLNSNIRKLLFVSNIFERIHPQEACCVNCIIESCCPPLIRWHDCDLGHKWLSSIPPRTPPSFWVWFTNVKIGQKQTHVSPPFEAVLWQRAGLSHDNNLHPEDNDKLFSRWKTPRAPCLF